MHKRKSGMELRNYDDNDNSDKDNCQHNCTLAVTHSQGQRSAKTAVWSSKEVKETRVWDTLLLTSAYASKSSRNCTSNVLEKLMSEDQNWRKDTSAPDTYWIRLSFWLRSMCQPTRMSTVFWKTISIPHVNSDHNTLVKKLPQGPAADQTILTIQATCPCDLVQLIGC